MCEGCYQRHTGGADPEVTDAMVRARGMLDELYGTDWGDTGGPLHVIVDDMNVGDESFESEQHEWIDRGFEEMCSGISVPGAVQPIEEGYDDAAKELCHRLYDALAGMTVPERAWVTRWRMR